MSETITALIVPSSRDEPIKLAEIERSHAEVSRIVGDNAEGVFPSAAPAVVFVAGNLKNQANPTRNERATELMDWIHPGFARVDWIAGTAVVLGIDNDAEDGWAAAPAQVLGIAEELFGPVQRTA